MSNGIGNPALHLIDSFDEAWEFTQWLEGREWVVVDTETTGLIQGQDFVRLVQVGGMDAGWAMRWDRWSGLFEDVIVNRFHKRDKNPIVMHNSTFDYGMLDHMGVRLDRGNTHDTRVMCHILEPNYSTALKATSSRHVDFAAAGAQVELEKYITGHGAYTWATIPFDVPQYWTYAALDTVLTAHLFNHHWPLIQTYREAYDLENAVQFVLYDMERRGLHIDAPYAVAQLSRFRDYEARLAEWALSQWGVSIGSNQKIVAILQAEGFHFDKVTASGIFSLDKDVLEDIDHPLANAVRRHRQVNKMASTYLRKFVDERDADDLIHPSINSLGARTGRMSISRPSLQNLPKKSDQNPFAESVRNCVTSRYGEDGTLLMCDFDQIEMRVLAHLSKDANLIDAFHTPEDFFVTLAREIYADPTIIKADKRRGVTKNVGYAQIYGAGAEKQARMAGVAVDQVRAVKARWDQLYPGVRKFQKEVESFAWTARQATGVAYAVAPLDGRRHPADEGKVYALVNYLIQGMAATMFKQSLLKLDVMLKGDYMVVPVHDEIVLDVPLDVVEDVARALRETMNDETTYRVPIGASVSIGERWGMKEDL
jgi:DNA polymerase-1